MTIGAETALTDQWVEATLLAHAPLTAFVSTRVYPDLAPPDITMPFVVYQEQSSDDVRGVGPTNILTTTVYVVKAIAQGSNFDALQPVAEAIYGALHNASGTITGGRVLTCLRDQPFRLTEFTDGKTYRHLGGRFSIQVQGT